jgi:hypothetical protein
LSLCQLVSEIVIVLSYDRYCSFIHPDLFSDWWPEDNCKRLHYFYIYRELDGKLTEPDAENKNIFLLQVPNGIT